MINIASLKCKYSYKRCECNSTNEKNTGTYGNQSGPCPVKLPHQHIVAVPDSVEMDI
jgi:hypothetical protein